VPGFCVTWFTVLPALPPHTTPPTPAAGSTYLPAPATCLPPLPATCVTAAVCSPLLQFSAGFYLVLPPHRTYAAFTALPGSAAPAHLRTVAVHLPDSAGCVLITTTCGYYLVLPHLQSGSAHTTTHCVTAWIRCVSLPYTQFTDACATTAALPAYWITHRTDVSYLYLPVHYRSHTTVLRSSGSTGSCSCLVGWFTHLHLQFTCLPAPVLHCHAWMLLPAAPLTPPPPAIAPILPHCYRPRFCTAGLPRTPHLRSAITFAVTSHYLVHTAWFWILPVTVRSTVRTCLRFYLPATVLLPPAPTDTACCTCGYLSACVTCHRRGHLPAFCGSHCCHAARSPRLILLPHRTAVTFVHLRVHRTSYRLQFTTVHTCLLLPRFTSPQRSALLHLHARFTCRTTCGYLVPATFSRFLRYTITVPDFLGYLPPVTLPDATVRHLPAHCTVPAVGYTGLPLLPRFCTVGRSPPHHHGSGFSCLVLHHLRITCSSALVTAMPFWFPATCGYLPPVTVTARFLHHLPADCLVLPHTHHHLQFIFYGLPGSLPGVLPRFWVLQFWVHLTTCLDYLWIPGFYLHHLQLPGFYLVLPASPHHLPAYLVLPLPSCLVVPAADLTYIGFSLQFSLPTCLHTLGSHTPPVTLQLESTTCHHLLPAAPATATHACTHTPATCWEFCVCGFAFCVRLRGFARAALPRGFRLRFTCAAWFSRTAPARAAQRAPHF